MVGLRPMVCVCAVSKNMEVVLILCVVKLTETNLFKEQISLIRFHKKKSYTHLKCRRNQ